MKQSFFTALLITILITLASHTAQATSCFSLSCKESLARNELVFKGKALASGRTTPEMEAKYSENKKHDTEKDRGLPDTYTDFEVISLYKGVLGDKVRIFYASHRRGGIAGDFDVNAYPDGQETIVYATSIADFYITYRGICSGCHNPEELETIKTKYDAVEELIKKYPKTAEFYLKKIALYDENKDFEAAAAAYERAFAALPSIKENLVSMADYGRILFMAQRYEEAIRVLEPLKSNVDALSYLQQSRLQLGKTDDLANQKLEMSGKEVTNLTISDKDLSGSNFSGAKLNGVKFINVKLKNADFTNTVMHVEISGSDLSGAKFDGVKIRGKITDSKFDKSTAKGAEIDLDNAGGNSFKDVDFTAAKLFIMDCRFVKDLRGNDFGGARFRDATISGLAKSNVSGADFTNTNFYANKCVSRNDGIDLSEKNFDNAKFDLGDYTGGSFKNTSLKNATFIGDNLTGVDFRGADLTGANFTTSTYSGAGPVKLNGADFTGAKTEGVIWTGAQFDCKTKFPLGFKPEEHEMETKDRSCESVSLKNPGVINYDRERLNRGYMTVCNGDYHADCIYGFLASFHTKHQDWSYQEDLSRLAQSFIEAGYPNLAKIIALKMIGGTALSKRSLDPKYFAKWSPLMEKIERLEQGPAASSAEKPSAQAARLLARDRSNLAAQFAKAPGKAAIALTEAAQEYADSGSFEAALAYAKEIGSDEYNRVSLGWNDKNEQKRQKTSGDHTQKQGYFAAAMSIALEQQWQKGDATASIDELIASTQKKPEGRDQQMFAAAAMIAGMDSRRPDLIAAAYAATNRIENAWEIYSRMKSGNDPGEKLAVLSALADHYSRHPDSSGIKKLTDELKTYAIANWPQQGDMIYMGIEIGIHEKLFSILGELKSKAAIEAILPLIEAYPNEDLKARARLYAASALVKAGSINKGFEYFEKCKGAISDTPPPTQGKRAPQFIIMLSPSDSKAIKTANIMLQDKDFGDFIFTVALSTASEDEKLKALNAGFDLIAAGKAGSPMFRAQLAIANAAVKKDKDSGQKMMDAQYGVPPSIFADLLHQGGFHTAEKKLIEISWASADAPPAVGIERLGFRTGYQAMRHGQQLAALAGMFARDGYFEDAKRAAETILNPSAVQRIAGTDFSTYFAQQKAFYNIALSALRQDKKDIARSITKENVTYMPYQAGVYFALARAELVNKQIENGRTTYDNGYNKVSSFGDAMGAPLIDPDGLALEALVDRAAAEKMLQLEDRYLQTLSYAKLAASLAENDVQRGKTSSVVDRINQLSMNKANEPKQSIEDFIKTLNIRDDLNSTSVVKEMAEKYLNEGDKERARAIAMYGFRNIDHYPQASGKNTVLLPYASIVARTEPRMSEEAQSKIEEILREVHPNTPGGKIDASEEKVDFVAEGAVAYKELKRRSVLDEAPPNEGDLEHQYSRDGTFQRGGQQLMQEWLAGATKKYNAEHPESQIALPTEVPNPSIITREITLPTQQYGGPFNGWYIVPADIPRPKGHRHDSTIFYMSDFTCEGKYLPYCKY